MPPQPMPEAPLERERSPGAEPAIVSAGDGKKHARTLRELTNNVSTLGEKRWMEVDTVTSFLDDVESKLLTNRADYREPESFQEYLDCAKHNK